MEAARDCFDTIAVLSCRSPNQTAEAKQDDSAIGRAVTGEGAEALVGSAGGGPSIEEASPLFRGGSLLDLHDQMRDGIIARKQREQRCVTGIH